MGNNKVRMYHSLRSLSTAARSLWVWTRPWRGLLLGGTLALFASSALLLVLPQLIGLVVADLPALRVGRWATVAAALLAQTTLGFLATYWFGLLAARAVIAVREHVFGRLVNAPIGYHDQSWSANLMSVLMSDALFIEQTLGAVLPGLVQHVPVALVVVLLLLLQNPILTAWLLLAGFPLVLLTLLTGRALRRITHRGQATLGEMAVVANESLVGLRVIKALGREQFFIDRFGAVTQALYVLKRRRVIWQAAMQSILPTGAVILGLCSVWLVQRQLASGQVTAGELARYLAYVGVLGLSLARLVQVYVGVENMIGAARRIEQVQRSAIEVERAAGRPITSGPIEIAFRDVSFAYPGQRGGVHNVSFTVAPGEVVAIVGANGAGKSTLMHLLLRLYEPSSGTITFNGYSQGQISLASWRQRIAIMSRDPAIFSLSVADNIRLGRLDADRGEIEQAARSVGLHDFITRLPGGYDARIGDAGVQLSSGQRQRLALARMFLQNPSIVILDEATTSLDVQSEAGVVAALSSWLGERTLLVIAHGVQPQWPIERVLHMQDGRLLRDERVARQPVALS
jgi:ATP-binding cassette, subfamily B, bacterial